MDMEKSMKKPRHTITTRAIVLLVSLVLVLSAAIGGTLGYLTSQMQVSNTMEVGTIGTEINENTDSGVKSNVTVTNTGNSDAYIRAVVVVTWQDEAGNIYPQVPAANTDYTITYGENWQLVGNCYYYNEVVPAGGTTENLIGTCEPVAGKAPEGYDLNVEILASAIQADPPEAVQQAWGMTFNGSIWAEFPAAE